MTKQAEVRIHNTRPSVINLPEHGRYRPRLLPGTNRLPKEYWDKIMSPVKSGPETVESPTKRMLVDTGVVEVLANEAPDRAPAVDPVQHQQMQDNVPPPESILHMNELDAFALIGGTDNPDVLVSWGKEAHEHGKEDLVDAIASRLQGLGFSPGSSS